MLYYYGKKFNHFPKGFTLIEIMIATILVGLAVTALVVANNAFTQSNGASVELSTAEFLIEQIRELTTLVAVRDPQTTTITFGPEESSVANYDDLDDFDSASFSPPINITRSQLNDLSAYTQRITVQNVNASNFEQVVSDHSSPFVRITVDILYNSRQISTASWLRTVY